MNRTKISMITLHLVLLFVMFLTIILGKTEKELERVQNLCLEFIETLKEE